MNAQRHSIMRPSNYRFVNIIRSSIVPVLDFKRRKYSTCLRIEQCFKPLDHGHWEQPMDLNLYQLMYSEHMKTSSTDG